MTKEDPREGSRPDSKPEIAAADWLSNESSAPSTVQPHGSPDATAGSGEVFALAEAPGSDEPAPPPIPRGSQSDRPAAKPRETHTERAHDKPGFEPSALVEQTWSRWAEWGPNVLIVGGWLLFLLLFVYVLLGQELYGLAFLALLLGGLGAVVLSYPILITLERPVRVTPEQAVRDYYTALSHHVPHLRRMWLLLSTAGRTSTSYGSFEGFKAYWTERLGVLKRGYAGKWTPLVFEVVNFKADKSAGQTQIDAEFTLKISVRGKRSTGPIHMLPMRIALVRGSDKMWYLENGTLTRSAR
jgi:hypothetical protein